MGKLILDKYLQASLDNLLDFNAVFYFKISLSLCKQILFFIIICILGCIADVR